MDQLRPFAVSLLSLQSSLLPWIGQSLPWPHERLLCKSQAGPWPTQLWYQWTQYSLLAALSEPKSQMVQSIECFLSLAWMLSSDQQRARGAFQQESSARSKFFIAMVDSSDQSIIGRERWLTQQASCCNAWWATCPKLLYLHLYWNLHQVSQSCCWRKTQHMRQLVPSFLFGPLEPCGPVAVASRQRDKSSAPLGTSSSSSDSSTWELGSAHADSHLVNLESVAASHLQGWSGMISGTLRRSCQGKRILHGAFTTFPPWASHS